MELKKGKERSALHFVQLPATKVKPSLYGQRNVGITKASALQRWDLYTVDYICGIVKNCAYYRCGNSIMLSDRIVSVLQIWEKHAVRVCGATKSCP